MSQAFRGDHGCSEQDFSLFVPAWLENHLNTLTEVEKSAFLEQYCNALHATLVELSKHPINQASDGTEAGTFHAKIPGTNAFVNIRQVLLIAAKYGIPLALTAPLAGPYLAVLGLTATAGMSVATVAGAVTAVYSAFAKLNQDEMDTYAATAAAIERNKNRVLANSGASVADINKSFDSDKRLFSPTDLRAMLSQLEKKQVIRSEVLGGVQQYYLAF